LGFARRARDRWPQPNLQRNGEGIVSGLSFLQSFLPSVVYVGEKLGFASLNPTYKNGEGIVLRNPVSDKGRDRLGPRNRVSSERLLRKTRYLKKPGFSMKRDREG